MKEVNVYECELYGERFDSKNECMLHELAEDYWYRYRNSGAQSRVFFWDVRGELLPIEYALGDLEEVSTMKILGEDMLEWCKKAFGLLGYQSPWDDGWDDRTEVIYFWDGDYEFGDERRWCCLETEKEIHLGYIKSINDILQKLN